MFEFEEFRSNLLLLLQCGFPLGMNIDTLESEYLKYFCKPIRPFMMHFSSVTWMDVINRTSLKNVTETWEFKSTTYIKASGKRTDLEMRIIAKLAKYSHFRYANKPFFHIGDCSCCDAPNDLFPDDCILPYQPEPGVKAVYLQEPETVSHDTDDIKPDVMTENDNLNEPEETEAETDILVDIKKEKQDDESYSEEFHMEFQNDFAVEDTPFVNVDNIKQEPEISFKIYEHEEEPEPSISTDTKAETEEEPEEDESTNEPNAEEAVKVLVNHAGEVKIIRYKPVSIACHYENCNKVFNSNKGLTVHMNACHPTTAVAEATIPSTVPKYHCSIRGCRLFFFNDSQVRVHERKCDKLLNKFSCKFHGCRSVFKSSIELHIHAKEMHSNQKLCLSSYSCRVPGCTFSFSSNSHRTAHEGRCRWKYSLEHESCSDVESTETH